MIWFFILLIVVYIFYAYLKSREKNQLKDNLRNDEFRKSYIQNIIEQEFQSYLQMDLDTVSQFKKKLAEAEINNDENTIKEVKGQIKWFNDEIFGLKEIKRNLQKNNNAIWNHTNFSDEGIAELKEEISDSFSHSALYPFHRR